MYSVPKKKNTDFRLFRPSNRRGAALLIVLFVVMGITLVSLAFITRSDRELEYGNNLTVRSRVDSAAQAGLEQAKTFLLHSQDIELPAAGFWQGASGQQLESGSEYFYDVLVERIGSSPDDSCGFRVVSTGYRLKDHQKYSVSSLEATLRIDPCIALWNSGNWQGDILTEVYGDACFGNTTSGSLKVYGDVFAKSAVDAQVIEGRTKISGSLPLSAPSVSTAFFSSGYYIESEYFTVETLTEGTCSSVNYDSSSANPAAIYYYDGDLTLESHNTIEGTLVVTGNLAVNGFDNTVIAKQGFPAVLLGGNLVFESEDSELEVQGLAKIGSTIHIENDASDFSLTVEGSLFVMGGGIAGDTSSDGTITVIADHMKSSLLLWPSPDTPFLWSPALGAYYTTVNRN